MTWWTASARPRSIEALDSCMRRLSAARLANGGFSPPTMSAKPSRSNPANHVPASRPGVRPPRTAPRVGHIGERFVHVEHQKQRQPRSTIDLCFVIGQVKAKPALSHLHGAQQQ
jgi:hypothetical protein